MRTSLVLLAAALLFQDPVKDLKSKDVLKRLAAVDALAADAKGEKALLPVLKDKREDWEVVERAALGLAAHGTAESADELVKLAVDAPVRAIRLAAARTLCKTAPKAAAEALLKAASGKEALHALDSLDALIAAKPAEALELKGLDKLAERAKEVEVRAAAARALVRSHTSDRAEVLKHVLAVESVAIQCAALSVCVEEPRTDCEAALFELLGRVKLSDLSERRAVRALASSLGVAAADSKRLDPLRALATSKDAAPSARAARVLARMGDKLDASVRLDALGGCLGHKETGARAAAARALRGIGGPEATKRAAELFESDKEARVRAQGLESYVALAATQGEEARAEGWKRLIVRLPLESDAGVRERIAVHLGQKGLVTAVEALTKAIADPSWTVAVCAAVSLGRTQSGPAVDVLARTLKEHKDWKLRGAAAAGLGQTYVMASLDPLAEALADPDKYVAATAHACLVSLVLQPLAPKVDVWKDWLAKHAASLKLNDPKTRDEIAKREKERGTFVDATSRERELTRVYKDLALFVLDSRGDHIQTLLGRFKIQHTLTQAGHVGELALQPDALFVSNCTGEIEEKDVERLSWFVRVGGHLFGSCWALTETIVRIAPGVLVKTDTASEVLDHVEAEAAEAGSEYLDGVFGPSIVPIYELEGAHLIDVLDPERAEVLVDSPICAEHWGSGNLAAWFAVGHGIVLDSVNHFDVQGLELAEGLKSREDRQAYAIDHMGLAWNDLRAVKDEKFWENSLKASEKIADLSVFRLVTNFVTRWRIEVGR